MPSLLGKCTTNIVIGILSKRLAPQPTSQYQLWDPSIHCDTTQTWTNTIIQWDHLITYHRISPHKTWNWVLINMHFVTTSIFKLNLWSQNIDYTVPFLPMFLILHLLKQSFCPCIFSPILHWQRLLHGAKMFTGKYWLKKLVKGFTLEIMENRVREIHKQKSYHLNSLKIH